MTDTGKWGREWFQNLPIKLKCLWLYILDACDFAGIWAENYGLATYSIGVKVLRVDLEMNFPGKFVRIDEDKLFIPTFISFQYGALKADSKPHLAVRRELEKYGIDPVLLTLSKGYAKGNDTTKDKDKDKDKDQDKDKDKDSADEIAKITIEDLEAIYQTYPRKLGKSKGLQIAAREIETPDDLFALETAVRRYTGFIEAQKTKPEYIKHFSTFMTSWRDWLDPAAGTATVASEEENRFAFLDQKEGA